MSVQINSTFQENKFYSDRFTSRNKFRGSPEPRRALRREPLDDGIGGRSGDNPA